MERIILNRIDIENIIAEKYNLNPQNGDTLALVVESKTVMKDTVDAKKVYYPVAYIWKENDSMRGAEE